MLLQRSLAKAFVSSTWSSKAVSHPSTIQTQCCLSSVFEWELVFPTWHGLLTRCVYSLLPLLSCSISGEKFSSKNKKSQSPQDMNPRRLGFEACELLLTYNHCPREHFILTVNINKPELKIAWDWFEQSIFTNLNQISKTLHFWLG